MKLNSSKKNKNLDSSLISELVLSDLYENSKKIIEYSAEGNQGKKNLLNNILNFRDGKIGLNSSEVATLLSALDTPIKSDDRAKILNFSRILRRKLFLNRVATMIPIEISSFCTSNCKFCGWRATNIDMPRLRINKKALLAQINMAVEKGFSHIELVAADDIDFIKNDLLTTVAVASDYLKAHAPEVRISICITPLTSKMYKEIKKIGVHTVLTWQETYNKNCYINQITSGPKLHGLNDDLTLRRDSEGFIQRLQSYEIALLSGLQIGMGVMFGLADLKSDVLALISHAHLLIQKYRENIKPIIFGMPTLNQITTEINNTYGTNQITNINEFDFELIAAVYLISLPDFKAWVFPNCRVSIETQINSILTAGCFTSTTVRVGPGAYLLEKINWQNKDEYFDKIKLAGNKFSEATILKGEQFKHHYHNQVFYNQSFDNAGLKFETDYWFLARSDVINE